MNWIKHIDWSAWISTLLLIVIFREASVWLMTQLNHPELGNLVGLLSLLIALLLGAISANSRSPGGYQ